MMNTLVTLIGYPPGNSEKKNHVTALTKYIYIYVIGLAKSSAKFLKIYTIVKNKDMKYPMDQ